MNVFFKCVHGVPGGYQSAPHTPFGRINRANKLTVTEEKAIQIENQLRKKSIDTEHFMTNRKTVR